MCKIVKYIINLFLPRCTKCGVGHLHIIGEEPTERFLVWKTIYECDKCYTKFV